MIDIPLKYAGYNSIMKGLIHMISIKKNSEFSGAEKYGQCASCSKGSSDAELYRISFTYDGSTKTHSIDLCPECMEEMKNMIEDIQKSDEL